MFRGLVTGAAAGLSRAAAVLAALCSLICLAIVCGTVIARYFFGIVPSWSDEVGGWFVVGVVMLALGEAQRRGENIGVDLLIERARGRARRGLQAFGILCMAATAAILLWQGWEAAAFSKMIGAQPLSIDGIPLWIIQGLIPLGAALLLVVTLAQLLRLAGGEDPYPESDHGPRATE